MHSLQRSVSFLNSWVRTFSAFLCVFTPLALQSTSSFNLVFYSSLRSFPSARLTSFLSFPCSLSTSTPFLSISTLLGPSSPHVALTTSRFFPCLAVLAPLSSELPISHVIKRSRPSRLRILPSCAIFLLISPSARFLASALILSILRSVVAPFRRSSATEFVVVLTLKPAFCASLLRFVAVSSHIISSFLPSPALVSSLALFVSERATQSTPLTSQYSSHFL